MTRRRRCDRDELKLNDPYSPAQYVAMIIWKHYPLFSAAQRHCPRAALHRYVEQATFSESIDCTMPSSLRTSLIFCPGLSVAELPLKFFSAYTVTVAFGPTARLSVLRAQLTPEGVSSVARFSSPATVSSFAAIALLLAPEPEFALAPLLALPASAELVLLPELPVDLELSAAELAASAAPLLPALPLAEESLDPPAPLAPLELLEPASAISLTQQPLASFGSSRT